MKICIVSLGKSLGSKISPRFGRAPFFLILNDEGDIEEVLKNPGVGAMRGAGVAAAQEISSRGVKVLISGNVGPNAFGALDAVGITVFTPQVGTTVERSFEDWKNNSLPQLEKPTAPGNFGRGLGSGRGRRRRGR
ncbi:MAG: dinitrogenase iron-molybdenum cofactor biosynthesis protein [Candidatus Nealsonbacteria bacterium]|nr:dinitrogenase iron-molybdenum cofactor biosynthesis protein [Candidatus Nealsonbacteria bacterium]